MTTAAQHGQAIMESVDSYLEAVMSAIRPLAARELSLAGAEADGAVLASDVSADWPLPPFDNSAWPAPARTLR